jgi:hypothetical protein
MLRESLDAPEDLSKQALRQVAPGQLEPEVPGMSHETPAGLEEPLLQAGQGPALDGDRQGEPAQQTAQVVGDDPEQEADLIRPEAVAGEARPVGGGFPFLDPLVGRPAPLVEADDGPVRPGQRSGGEAPRGNYSPRFRTGAF